jgi:phosphate transport system substrate-binding protein
MKTRSILVRRLALIISFLLLLIPFSSHAQTLPPVNPSEVTGDIRIAGATPLIPVTENIATLFSLEGYGGNISIEATGTDAAMTRLCNGELDLVLADRQISPAEINACSATGRPPLAFRVATSAVIVTTNRLNNFLNDVSTTELQLIWGTAGTWNEIRSDWPNEVIGRYGPGVTSTEFNLFATVVFGGDVSRLSTALGAQFNDDPNVSLGRVAESPFAVAFFEASYALNNNNLVRGVNIDGVEPSFNNIADNLYPLSRPLIIYSTSRTFQELPQVASFMNYYLSNIETQLNTSGLFPAPPNALQVARNTWLGSTGQAVPTQVVELPVTTEEPTVVVTDVPVATEVAPPTSSAFTPDVQQLLVNARLDLELIVNELMGVERPAGWSGALDINNPQLPILLRLDTESTAAIVYGAESRPAEWFGAINSTTFAIARDIRHDVELLADSVFFGGQRPSGWAGADPVYRCDRTTQAMVTLLRNSGVYTITIDPFASDFCERLRNDITLFTEVNLLNPDVQVGASGVQVQGEIQIDTNFAVAFYDVNARQRAGVIPFGTPVTPIARSYNGFSNMTLVQGEGFLLFIEYQNMNIDQQAFRVMPNIEGRDFETVCNVVWCEF